MTAALLEVPGRAAEVLEKDAAIHAVAQRVAQARDVLFLGRGSCFFALQKDSGSETSRLMLNEDALALVVAAAFTSRAR